jgi:hypothetical protein
VEELPIDGKVKPADLISRKLAIAGRLRHVRSEIFGDSGVPELADQLGLPPQTWLNFEIGVTIPRDVLLRFLEITGANPVWLLRGEGPSYEVPPPAANLINESGGNPE